MRQHTEEITLPYSVSQLYALVADVEKYPEFIPWCVAARIRERDEKSILADLVVGFKGITEKYTSRVHLRENEIEVEYISGPFAVLENNWKFTAVENGAKISFLIKFQFKSKILQTLIGGLFETACHKMVSAFTERAKVLFMSYEKIDHILLDWANSNNLKINKEYKDYEVRSTHFFISEKKFQIWIDKPQDDKILVHLSDNKGKTAKNEVWSATIENLQTQLQEAFLTANKWAAE